MSVADWEPALPPLSMTRGKPCQGRTSSRAEMAASLDRISGSRPVPCAGPHWSAVGRGRGAVKVAHGVALFRSGWYYDVIMRWAVPRPPSTRA